VIGWDSVDRTTLLRAFLRVAKHTHISHKRTSGLLDIYQ